MHDAHVTCQCVIPAECLFLSAQVTPDLLLAIIVDRIFVSRKVVAAAEDRVARLAGARVDLLTLVWTRLVVARDIVGSCLLIVGCVGGGGSGRCR